MMLSSPPEERVPCACCEMQKAVASHGEAEGGGVQGHMRRALSVQAPPAQHAPLRRPGALKSAVATLNPFQDSFTSSNLKQLGSLGEVSFPGMT